MGFFTSLCRIFLFLNTCPVWFILKVYCFYLICTFEERANKKKLTWNAVDCKRIALQSSVMRLLSFTNCQLFISVKNHESNISYIPFVRCNVLFSKVQECRTVFRWCSIWNTIRDSGKKHLLANSAICLLRQYAFLYNKAKSSLVIQIKTFSSLYRVRHQNPDKTKKFI